MSAWEPIAATRDADVAGAGAAAFDVPFDVWRPPAGVAPTPLVFASPHSGRIYPASMMAASQLGAQAIRRSEDAYVDSLIEAAPAHGATVIAARLARAYLDLNREPWELDARMFADDLPAYAKGRSARVAAGLGAIARTVGDGQEIYARKLTFAEGAARVEAVHGPYHDALGALIAEARGAHGLAILIDWHSMPAAAAAQAAGGRGCDMVVGDRFGVACAPAISRRVEQELAALGYSVARNSPYAGGYTTQRHGQPHRGVHAVQIEVNRGLYLDEARVARGPGFSALKGALEQLFASLSCIDWAAA